MSNFFITGLPRSRTSWMANFFTYQNSYCFHEISNNHPHSFGIRDELMNKIQEYKGVSDCLLPYYFEPLADTLENSILVIIERDFHEVFSSLNNWYKDNNLNIKNSLLKNLKELDKRLTAMKERYPHLLVKFEDLDDISVMEEMWYHCVPGIRFDSDRWQMLNNFKIEPEYNKYMTNLKNENVMKLMGVL